MPTSDSEPQLRVHQGEPRTQSRAERPSILRWIDPSLALAAVGTVAYYGVILQPSMHGSLLHRYTTEHIVEYAIVALFIWAIVDVMLKCARFPREFRASRQEWLPPCRGREPVQQAHTLLQRVLGFPRWQQESRQGRWLREMLEVITEKGSSQTCREDHQRILDREDDKLHNDYSLIRFVIAVTPILGFLGTVVHFGTALSGMSFEEMTDSLPHVVSEMGMAFNTTTVALAAAMITMMLMFLCERVERQLMRSIERYVEREIVSRFESREQPLEPLLAVLQSSHETALTGISMSLANHMEQWASKVDTLLQRFDWHQEQAAAAWQAALENLQQQHAGYSANSEERLRESLTAIDATQDKHLLTIQGLLNEAAGFRDEFAELTRALETLVRGEGRLAEVQDTLAGNLRLLHQTGQIDEALHGLTAAIHLMTVRHRPDVLDAAA